jgi:hypothetical protein
MFENKIYGGSKMEIIKDESEISNSKIKCECGNEDKFDSYYAAHCMMHLIYTCPKCGKKCTLLDYRITD